MFVITPGFYLYKKSIRIHFRWVSCKVGNRYLCFYLFTLQVDTVFCCYHLSYSKCCVQKHMFRVINTNAKHSFPSSTLHSSSLSCFIPRSELTPFLRNIPGLSLRTSPRDVHEHPNRIQKKILKTGITYSRVKTANSTWKPIYCKNVVLLWKEVLFARQRKL